MKSNGIFYVRACGLFILCVAWASIALASTTATFQNGVDGYSGTYDRRIDVTDNIDGANVDTSTTVCWIDGDPQDANRSDYLIRFDNIIGGSGIPAGAIILYATLDLHTVTEVVHKDAQAGESYNVYRLTKMFDSNSTLDGDFGDGNGAFTNWVDGVEPEQGEADWNTGVFDRPFGSSTMAFDTTYSADVTRAVQSWVNGATNYGLAVMSDHIDNDDGWGINTTGTPIVANRPQLTVTYTTNPNVQVFELQDGVNGYDGTTDIITSYNTAKATIDGSTVSEAFLDGLDLSLEDPSYDDPYLVRFDLTGLPIGDKVLRAELVLKTGVTSGASDSGGPFTVHQLLVPFSTSSVYSDFAGEAAAMEAAGQIAAEAARVEGIDEAELMSVDITSIVQNWFHGDPNYGIYIGANGTSNGWQIFTSGAVDPDLAPMLRIYTIPEPSTLWLALGGFALMLATKRRGH
ncbi:MAG: DNRLRE domain-containing protein [Pirellulales bacterium]|nr:DNRLRE domain-containing protein [Pirellulales bacterium]